MKILAIVILVAATAAVSAQTAPYGNGAITCGDSRTYSYSSFYGDTLPTDEGNTKTKMHKINVPTSPPTVLLSNCALGKCDPLIKHVTGADCARSDFKDYCQKRKADFGWQKCYVFLYTESEAGKPTKYLRIDGDGTIHRHGVSLHDALLIVASNALWSAH